MGELIIPKGGDRPVRGIYAPEVQTVAQALGKVETRRASHVEPTEELSQEAKDWIWNNIQDLDVAVEGLPAGEMSELHDQLYPPSKWWADCLPVGGPVLGPFEDRDTALAKESEWLKANNIPTCRPCADNPTHESDVPEACETGVECSIQIEPPEGPVMTQADLGANSPHSK